MDDFKFYFFLLIALLFGIALIITVSAVLGFFFLPLHPLRFIISLFVGISVAICFIYLPFLDFIGRKFDVF